MRILIFIPLYISCQAVLTALAVSRFREGLSKDKFQSEENQSLARKKYMQPVQQSQQKQSQTMQPQQKQKKLSSTGGVLEGRYQIESIVEKLEIKRRTEGKSVDGHNDSMKREREEEETEEETAREKLAEIAGFEPGIRRSIRKTIDRSDSRVRFEVS